MTIIVSGRTFDHRPALQAMGGWWNNHAKHWEFEHLSSEMITALRNTVGIVVTEPRRAGSPPAQSKPSPLLPCHEPMFIGDDDGYRYSFADDPLIAWGFSSLGKFIDHVEAVPRMPSPYDKAFTGPASFTGTDSLPEAIEIARHGWLGPLGLADLLDIPHPHGKRRQPALAGGMVNVGRMLAGDPKHMIRRAKAPRDKIITLFVETVSWIGINHDVLLIRAMAVAAIVDRLESNGYRCKVVAVYSCYRDDWEPMQMTVALKDAGERLSITDIGFAFGHPSFGRRLIYQCRSIPQAFTETDSERARGFVNAAFDDEHRPGPNEFYICGIMQNTLDIFDILAIIQPDDLPLKIERP